MSGGMDRRAFLGALGAGAAALASGRALHAQQTGAANVQMDGSAYRPVRLESKGTPALLDRKEIEQLEHRLACACPCNLSVFTCRTTDFTCTISPAMHRDIVRLVEGGYSEREIIDAHVQVYGLQVLMAPPKSGFNLVAYLTPFAALGGGATVVALLLRRWRREAEEVAPAVPVAVDATSEELARLEAALRRDDE